MKTIAYLNVKGGTGKTSMSLIMARVLSQNGHRVLFIDSDPQNAASFYLTDTLTPNTLSKIYNGWKIKENVLHVEWGFDLVPADLNLMRFGNLPDHLLKKALKEVEKEYDFCIIDGLPYYNDLMRNPMIAADVIIVPTTVDSWGKKTCQFMIEEMIEMEIEAEVYIFLNMWTPSSRGQNVFDNVMGRLFLDDPLLKEYCAENHFYNSRPVKRLFMDKGYKIMTPKTLEAIKAHIEEMTGINIGNLEEIPTWRK